MNAVNGPRGAAAPHALRLDRTLAASRERVWRALTDPTEFAAWFWPPSFQTSAEIDARPGGSFRVYAPTAPGGGLGVTGTFRAVEPGHRLVFTWRWDGDDEETLVTIELTDTLDGVDPAGTVDGVDPAGTVDGVDRAGGVGTALSLTHERFATPAGRDDHRTGWSDCLDRLPGWLESAGPQ
jgi:uncharacterized protein YndB with AHSA1/START domain